jgi:hypothetical protein
MMPMAMRSTASRTGNLTETDFSYVTKLSVLAEPIMEFKMDLQIKKQKMTKQEGATVQVEAAIDALTGGNFGAAITLAGAAEGMIDEKEGDMFRVMVKAPDVITKEEETKWISTLNGERDWLKHPTKNDPRDVLEPSNMDAGFMIARAASKLDKWTPKIEEFKTWFLKMIEILKKQ